MTQKKQPMDGNSARTSTLGRNFAGRTRVDGSANRQERVWELSCFGGQILDNHIQSVLLTLKNLIWMSRSSFSFFETSMFSQTAEYALRAVVFLASQEGKPRTTQEIALATKVPIGYLSKVMQGLGRKGLVHSQRGLHGGFTLARSAEELTVLDIIQA